MCVYVMMGSALGQNLVHTLNQLCGELDFSYLSYCRMVIVTQETAIWLHVQRCLNVITAIILDEQISPVS